MPDEPPTHDPRERRCLRLRGLPFGVTEEQIALFLSPCATLESAVVCRRDGKCTGHAFAVCSTAAEAAHAFSTLNKAYLGHRYVEIFNALPQEVDAALAGVIDYDGAQHRDGGRSSSGGGRGAVWPMCPGGEVGSTSAGGRSRSQSRSPTAQSLLPSLAWSEAQQLQQQQRRDPNCPVVRLANVPKGVRPKDVLDWIEPAHCAGGIKGIHYVLGETGFFTGEAFVELQDQESLQAALSKDGAALQGSAVQVTLSSAATVHERFGPPSPKPCSPTVHPLHAVSSTSSSTSSASSSRGRGHSQGHRQGQGAGQQHFGAGRTVGPGWRRPPHNQRASSGGSALQAAFHLPEAMAGLHMGHAMGARAPHQQRQAAWAGGIPGVGLVPQVQAQQHGTQHQQQPHQQHRGHPAAGVAGQLSQQGSTATGVPRYYPSQQPTVWGLAQHQLQPLAPPPIPAHQHQYPLPPRSVPAASTSGGGAWAPQAASPARAWDLFASSPPAAGGLRSTNMLLVPASAAASSAQVPAPAACSMHAQAQVAALPAAAPSLLQLVPVVQQQQQYQEAPQQYEQPPQQYQQELHQYHQQQ